MYIKVKIVFCCLLMGLFCVPASAKVQDQNALAPKSVWKDEKRSPEDIVNVATLEELGKLKQTSPGTLIWNLSGTSYEIDEVIDMVKSQLGRGPSAITYFLDEARGKYVWYATMKPGSELTVGQSPPLGVESIGAYIHPGGFRILDRKPWVARYEDWQEVEDILESGPRSSPRVRDPKAYASQILSTKLLSVRKITKQEGIALSKAVQKGNKAARIALAESMGLKIVREAKELARMNIIPLEEGVAAGYEASLRAAETYEFTPARNAAFFGYAYRWIFQALQRKKIEYLANKYGISPGLASYVGSYGKLQSALGRHPTADEIMQKVTGGSRKLGRKAAENLSRAMQNPVQSSTMRNDDGEFIPDDKIKARPLQEPKSMGHQNVWYLEDPYLQERVASLSLRTGISRRDLEIYLLFLNKKAKIPIRTLRIRGTISQRSVAPLYDLSPARVYQTVVATDEKIKKSGQQGIVATLVQTLEYRPSDDKGDMSVYSPAVDVSRKRLQIFLSDMEDLTHIGKEAWAIYVASRRMVPGVKSVVGDRTLAREFGQSPQSIKKVLKSIESYLEHPSESASSRMKEFMQQEEVPHVPKEIVWKLEDEPLQDLLRDLSDKTGLSRALCTVYLKYLGFIGDRHVKEVESVPELAYEKFQLEVYKVTGAFRRDDSLVDMVVSCLIHPAPKDQVRNFVEAAL